MIPTARKLRERCAGLQLPRYQLGARVGVHPARLGSYLAGRLPMPADVAVRIDGVLRELEQREHQDVTA